MQVGGVIGVVGAVVVEGADEDAVLEVGEPSSTPRPFEVVGLAPVGGDVAALGPAGAVADRHGEALSVAEEASGPAEVQRLRLAAEDGGDDPGGAGQPERFGRRESPGSVEAGPEARDADLAAELLEPDGDDQGGGRATVAGQDAGREGLEQGAEGAAEPDLQRRALLGRRLGVGIVCVVATWVGEGLEVGAQASGDGVGDAGVDLGGAVAAAAEGEAGEAAGAALLVLEGAAFVVLGDVGGDDLEDLAAQDSQVSRIEGGGLLDEVDLRPAHDVGVEVVGEVVERAGDDPGLLEVDAAGEESGADLVPAVLERFGDAGIGQGGAVAAAGVVGQPGGGAAGTGVIGHVVGGGKDPHPEAVEAVGGAGQLHQGLRLLARGHQHRVGERCLVHRRVHLGGTRQHRVAGKVPVLVHALTLDATTDIFDHAFERCGEASRPATVDGIRPSEPPLRTRR